MYPWTPGWSDESIVKTTCWTKSKTQEILHVLDKMCHRIKWSFRYRTGDYDANMLNETFPSVQIFKSVEMHKNPPIFTLNSRGRLCYLPCHLGTSVSSLTSRHKCIAVNFVNTENCPLVYKQKFVLWLKQFFHWSKSCCFFFSLGNSWLIYFRLVTSD